MARKQHTPEEKTEIYIVSVVGLLLSLFLMWLLHGKLGMWNMMAKILATAIVFIYNYLIRLLVVYRQA